MTSSPSWLAWSQKLQAIAQTGLTYCEDDYDRQRYEEIRRIAAEILAAQTDEPFEKILNIFQNQTGYPTPKVDVRAAVFKDGRILLVREKEDGKWTLPGGWADILETPSQAIEREVWEESGYKVRVTKLLAVYERNKQCHVPPFPFHVYKLFFRAEITGGTAAISAETTEVGFFESDSIPELSLTRVTPGEIARFFEHLKNPTCPTEFD